MPVSYEIDRARGLVRFEFRDPASVAATLERLRELRADPALPARLDLLVDLRGTPPDLPGSAELRAIASEIGRLGGRERFGACALVASSDSVYGVSRMFAVYAEPSFGASVQVFRELGEAEDWLAATRGQRSASTS
jgi:hypothetical protein